MTTVATDLRQTRESARRIRFEPIGTITATNVQDAIAQASAAAGVPVSTPVNAAMSPYAVLPSDRVLLVDTAGGPVVITMMAAAARNGFDLTVKDDTGNAGGANTIAVTRSGGDLIDGLTVYPLDSNYAAARFVPQVGGYYVAP